MKKIAHAPNVYATRVQKKFIARGIKLKSKVKAFIFSYIKKNKSYPSVKVIAVGTDLTTADVRQALHDLADDGILRKYPQEENGKVSSYHIPAEVLAQEMKPKPEEEKDLTPQVKGFSEKGLKIIGFIIRGFGAVIGGAAITISADFSLSWTASYLPIVIAWIVSLSIPMYTSFAIEAGIFIRYTTGIIKGKNLSWPAATILLFLTAFVAMGFEMSMITIGQFNKRSALIFTESEITKPKNNNSETFDILKSEENQILNNSDFKYLKNQIENYKNSFEFGSKEYKNLENDFLKKRNDFKIYEGKLEENRKKQKDILNDSKTVLKDEKKEERKDFYTWFANNFSWARAGIIEFIVYLMPALFFVLVAPLGVFVAVGLYRRSI
jgi:hypothetical protein